MHRRLRFSTSAEVPALGLDPNRLQAVQKEGVHALPVLPVHSDRDDGRDDR